jgi:hypothetical protein
MNEKNIDRSKKIDEVEKKIIDLNLSKKELSILSNLLEELFWKQNNSNVLNNS